MKLSELRELLAKATPGPWTRESWYDGHQTIPEVCGDNYMDEGDVRLVLALRNHAEALLDVVRAGDRLRMKLFTADYMDELRENMIRYDQARAKLEAL